MNLKVPIWISIKTWIYTNIFIEKAINEEFMPFFIILEKYHPRPILTLCVNASWIIFLTDIIIQLMPLLSTNYQEALMIQKKNRYIKTTFFSLLLGSSYYMPPHQGAVSAAAAASSSMHSQFGGASMHHMAAPFGSSFGGMVRFSTSKY